MPAAAVMVLGTTSGAGKSLVATGLCRWYRRQGLSVMPFKAQNMSNNARVADGGEIGAAQYYQSLAAGAVPCTAMNPVLLKPEGDCRSQVVVNGQVDDGLTTTPWRERGTRLWPIVQQALTSLRSRCDVLVIEGAGSPAEINLADCDFVNGRTAAAADARCLLVADIDRGGAFAHLFGTHHLVDDQTRSRIDGFVLNRFRGDPALLAPGPAMLEALTGVPTVACLPMWRDHGLPEEDGVFDRGMADRFDAGAGTQWIGGQRARLRIGIVAYPRISNLDEFEPLRHVPGIRLAWLRDPDAVAAADWLILPGSKQSSSDLRWLRERGFESAISGHAAAGKPLLAICGGLQMLGAAMFDAHGVDGDAQGLGLLPLTTWFEPRKTVRAARAAFGALDGPWERLSMLTVDGYEIRHGRTAADRVADTTAAARPVLAPVNDSAVIGWQRGSVLAIYLHGLFENPAVMGALFGDPGHPLEAAFERLADRIDAHFERRTLMALIGR
jgi:adenosylcobyric acid synthase